MYSTHQAAVRLGVSKATLLRWHADKKFLPSQIEPESGARYYDEEDINIHALWFALRRRHKAHLRKLKEVTKDDYKYISTTPLDQRSAPWEPLSLNELKKHFAAKKKWDSEYREILGEYSRIPSGFEPKIDVPYPGEDKD